MASKKKQSIYWDACVFLALVNKEPERANIISQLWENVADTENLEIVTSSSSVVEVSFSVSEKKDRRQREHIEAYLDGLWGSSNISLIEPHRVIMYEARALIRKSLSFSRVLKPMDAIHLASAAHLIKQGWDIKVFNTYDRQLQSDEVQELTGLKVAEPEAGQMRMFM